MSLTTNSGYHKASIPPVTTMLAIKLPVTITLFSFLFTQHTIAQPAPDPIDALPADASGILLMNTDAQAWTALTRFTAFPPDFSTPSQIFQFFAPNTNFSTDWQPWIGDRFGLGYMPDGKLVMIAPIKDATLASQFLDRFTQQQAKPPQKINHNGIEIQYWQPEKQAATPLPKTLPNPFTPQGFAIANLPNGYLVRTESPETIKQLINTTNQPRLSSHPDLQKLQQNPKYAPALFAGFGDYSKMIPALKEAQKQQPKALPPLPGMPSLPSPEIFQPSSELFDAIAQLYGSVSGIAWVEPTGIRLTTSVSLKQPLPAIVPSPQPPILSYVPGVSYLVSSGPNWGSLILSGQTPNVDPKLAEQLKKQVNTFQPLFQTFFGINEKELASLFGQESAFFVFPSKQGFLPNQTKVDLGFGLAARTSNRDETEAALEKVTQHLQKQLDKSVSMHKRTINGIPVVSLEAISPNTKGIQKLSESQRQSFFSYSWVQPDTVLILSSIDNNLIPKPWQIVTDSPNFKDAIAPLPKDHQGFFYMNGGASISFIFNSLLPQFVPEEMLQTPFVDSIKASAGSMRSFASTLQLMPDVMVGEGFVALGTVKSSPLTAADIDRSRINRAIPDRQPR
jgi:hypothetical protein